MPMTEDVPAAKPIVSVTADAAGEEAGHVVASVLLGALERQPRARVVFAAAPSQERMLQTLGADARIDWNRVDSFHMDDYLGLDPDHPATFGAWLAARIPVQALPGFERIDVAADPSEEMVRYSALLDEAPIDLVCLGIGVNGHIAFNEPGSTDLNDPALVRQVHLEHASRQQQVDEGLFESLELVPTSALTLTVPAILGATRLVCTVLGEAKADAVAAALTGSIRSDVPASALRGHDAVSIHLDEPAASQLPQQFVGAGSPA